MAGHPRRASRWSGATGRAVPLPKPAPFPKVTEAPEGKGVLSAKAEPPPWAPQLAANIETGGNSFANIFHRQLDVRHRVLDRRHGDCWHDGGRCTGQSGRGIGSILGNAAGDA
jgi:hypothetical protein